MKAFLGLGSNLGDRLKNLVRAVKDLDNVNGQTVDSTSSIYETKPVGKTDQPLFLNAAIGITTSLTADNLLTECLKIENDFGRQRIERWGPRPIDIDILFYGDEVVQTKNIVIPHPRLHERAFVLAPLADIAPDMKHPLFGRTVGELLNEIELTGIILTSYQLNV